MQVAERTCGTHAQVMSCADLQVWARSEPAPPPDAVGTALWEDRTLVRTWCMRGTLHLLTPEQLALCAAAFDPAAQYGPVWYRAFEVTPDEMERLTDAVVTALASDAALTRREIGDAVRARLGPRLGDRLSSSWGELLKPIARRGLIVNGPPRGQETTYVRTDSWLGSRVSRVSRDLGRDEARAELLRRYLAAYGPATREDFARWLGVRQKAPVTKALHALGSDACEVVVAGRPLLGLRSDLEAAASCPGPVAPPPVRLLPGFDCFVLGHANRDHLVPAEHRALVYRTAGWVSPTVLVDGAVAGTWEHATEGGKLAVRLHPFAVLDADTVAGVTAEAERLAAHFGLPLALYT